MNSEGFEQATRSSIDRSQPPTVIRTYHLSGVRGKHLSSDPFGNVISPTKESTENDINISRILYQDEFSTQSRKEQIMRKKLN